MALHLIEFAGPPSAAPDAVGQHYVDTANGDEYFSTGTSTVADWILRGSGGANNPMDADLDVNGFSIIGKPESGAATPGGDVAVVGGLPTDGGGGGVTITGADATVGGYDGGGFTFITGSGEAGPGSGGSILIETAPGLVSSGNIEIQSGVGSAPDGGTGDVDLDAGNVGTLSSGSGGNVDIDGGDGGSGPGTGSRTGGPVLINGGDGGDTDYATNGNDNTDDGGFASASRFRAGSGGSVTGNTVSHTAIGGTQGPPGSFVVVGDQTGIYNTPGFRFGYENDTGDPFGSDGGYTVTTASFGGVNTTINVNEEVGSGAATFDGDLYYDLATGSGASGGDLQIHAGAGGGASYSKGDIGHGGDLELYAGDAGFNEYNPYQNAFGGKVEIFSGDGRGSSGGGRVDIETGRGGPNGGYGGNFEVDCGDGGTELPTSTGNGGNIYMDAGDGGDAGGEGGAIRLIAGDAHFAATADAMGGWARLEGGRGGFTPYTPGANDGGDVFIQPGGHRDVDDVAAAGSVWFERINLSTIYTPAEVRWEDNQGGFVGWVGFKAPADVSAGSTGDGVNTVWTLPEGEGNPGECMVTDGSGVLSWTDAPVSNAVQTVAATTATVLAIPIPSGAAVRVSAQIAAFDTSSSEGGAGQYEAGAQNIGGTSTAVGAPITAFSGLSTASGSISVNVNDGTDELELQVTSGAANTISWKVVATIVVVS